MEKVGIDAGGSLIKIAYYENDHIHYKLYPITELERLTNWLQIISPTAEIRVTGGKSAFLQSFIQQKTKFIEEFQAVTDGARLLLKKEGHCVNDFILVSIGTGTSIYYVTENSYERIMGTGIGGGTFMGLGSLLSSHTSFKEIVAGADKGNRKQSDLLVSDIYENMESPLLGDLTAANFGKAHLNKDATANDHLAALVQLIGETITLLATSVAQAKGTNQIVFIGSTLNGNEPLKKVFLDFKNMLNYEPIFLKHGAYAGALGALLD